MQYIIKELEHGLYVVSYNTFYADIENFDHDVNNAARFSKKEAKNLLKNTTTNGVYTIIPVYFVES